MEKDARPGSAKRRIRSSKLRPVLGRSNELVEFDRFGFGIIPMVLQCSKLFTMVKIHDPVDGIAEAGKEEIDAISVAPGHKGIFQVD